METFLRDILTDESGKFSSARAQSIFLTLVGFMSVIVGFVMLACGIKDTSTYVGVVLAGAWGKSAADMWASQSKSARIKVATSTTVSTATSTAPAISATPTATQQQGKPAVSALPSSPDGKTT